MSPIIIGVTGLPSSGKGVFGEIAKEFGFKEIIMGDVVRNECKIRGLPVNRESSNKVMMDLRRERGENAVAIITLEWIHQAIEQGNKLILVDGIRSLAEVRTIRKQYPEFLIIAIHSDQKTRIQRAMVRKRIDDAFTINEFMKRDTIELNLGIGDVIATSNILVSSRGTLENTRTIIHEFLTDFLQEKEMEIEI